MRVALFFLFIFSVIAQETTQFHNRFFVRNTLGEIFGPKSHAIIDELYYKAGAYVGGPCDVYEQVYHQENSLSRPNARCFGGKQASKYPLFVESSILRTSLILKTCHALVEQLNWDERFDNSSFMKQVSRKFYPYGGDDELFNFLKAKYPEPNDSHKKEILLSYCISPGWQKV